MWLPDGMVHVIPNNSLQRNLYATVGLELEKQVKWKENSELEKRLLGISSSPGQCHGLLFRACRRQEPGAPISEQNLKESRVPESSSLSQRGRSRPEVFSAAGNLTGHINKSKRKSIPGLATRYSLGSQHKPPGLRRSYPIRKV